MYRYCATDGSRYIVLRHDQHGTIRSANFWHLIFGTMEASHFVQLSDAWCVGTRAGSTSG
jgi:hypothetical protein